MRVNPLLGIALLLSCGALICGVFANRSRVDANADERQEFFAEAPDVDLGALETGTESEVSFRLINKIACDVKIVRVLESCGCTKAVVSRNEIHQDQDAELRLRWRIGSMRGSRSVLVHVVYQRQPDGPEEVLVLKARAHVWSDLELTPDKLVFSADRAAMKEMKITSSSGKFKVTEACVVDPKNWTVE